MVMASWPAARRREGQSAMPPAIRRRVDHALHLDMRRALRIGGPLIAVCAGADALHLLLRFGATGAPAALLDVGAIAAALALAAAGRRAIHRPELPALLILLTLFGVTIANLRLLPQASATGVAYLAVILVISALFLSWTPRWHLAWLVAALSMCASLLVTAAGPAEMGIAVAAGVTAGIASLASLVGQRIAYLRLTEMLEHQFRLRSLSRHANLQERAVEDLNRELVRTARLDPVTGIGNRRALDEALASLTDRRLAAVLLDVDHFKAYNDRNGHLAGDAALARVGHILRSVVRDRDMVFRYGGEEFLVLLPDGDRDGAARLAERVRAAIEGDTAADLGLTVSAGVAAADRFRASTPLPLLRRADAALYRAKRTGRNRVVVDGQGAAIRELVG